MKKKVATLSALFMAAVLCLSGCGGSVNTAAEETSATAEEERASEAEKEETEAKGAETEAKGAETEVKESETEVKESEAKESKPEDTQTAILAVSFGTSYNDSRDVTIGAIEEAIARAYPQYPVRRAFTAQIIIDKLKERDGLEIDNVTEALDRAVADGIKTLIVQPTHLMNGLEYKDVLHELELYQEDFEQIVIGQPLLTDDEDFDAVAKAITDATSSYDDGETAIVFMGHGTEAESNQIYARMQETLANAGFEHYYIGTVEAEPTLDDVKASLKEAGNYKKVVLEPLMVVSGDHANNDMAGEEEDSWKTVLEGEGYEVECLLKGLGELEAIQNIYVQHVKEAIEDLDS